MGFLKFLKREKKRDASELDLPPEPPQLEGFEDTHDFPELPEIKAPDYFDMPKTYEMNDKGMPDFPRFPEMEEEPEAAAEPEMPSQPLASPAVLPMQAAGQKEMLVSEPQHVQRRGLFHHEKKAWEKPLRKEVYVRVDKFKAVLDDMSVIRAGIRKFDAASMHLESIKSSKDRSFDKVKASLEDLQKKLIFIDKTLFKGD